MDISTNNGGSNIRAIILTKIFGITNNTSNYSYNLGGGKVVLVNGNAVKLRTKNSK